MDHKSYQLLPLEEQQHASAQLLKALLRERDNANEALITWQRAIFGESRRSGFFD